MLSTLPHLGQTMIRAVVAGHRIRDMMKKEGQDGEKGAGNIDPAVVSGHGRTDPPPFGVSRVILSGFHG